MRTVPNQRASSSDVSETFDSRYSSADVYANDVSVFTLALKNGKRRKMTVLRMRITCKQKCDPRIVDRELWIAECTLLRFQS